MSHETATPFNILVLLFITMDYDMIYSLTVIGCTPGGSSTVHIYTQTTQNNTMKQNT